MLTHESEPATLLLQKCHPRQLQLPRTANMTTVLFLYASNNHGNAKPDSITTPACQSECLSLRLTLGPPFMWRSALPLVLSQFSLVISIPCMIS